MKFTPKQPPRRFPVGNAVKRDMHDCGTLTLEPDEQITFVTGAGAEFDVARKEWGFYATPSLNGRLASLGLRAVLIRNRLTDRYFVLLVERGHETTFHRYLDQECCDVVAWLDSTDVLSELRARMTQVARS